MADCDAYMNYYKKTISTSLLVAPDATMSMDMFIRLKAVGHQWIMQYSNKLLFKINIVHSSASP